MSPRAGLSWTLLLGACVLVAAILIGDVLGRRVILQIATRAPIARAAVPLGSPSPQPSGAAALESWKRTQIFAVATDPAFPDPRVTPIPPPAPKPRPTPKPRSPAPVTATPAAPFPSATASGSQAPYTSPPLPLPIVTHDPSPDLPL
ncbi:MAG: hypothetical protein ACREM2_01315 [Vulcanimicrobiaceae bacterium]